MFRSKEIAELVLLLLLTCSHKQMVSEALNPVYFVEQPVDTTLRSNLVRLSQERLAPWNPSQIGEQREVVYNNLGSSGRHVSTRPLSPDKLKQILDSLVWLPLIPIESEDSPELGKRVSADWSPEDGQLIVKPSVHRKPTDTKKLWPDRAGRESFHHLSGSEEIPFSSPAHSMNNRRWNREPSANSRWNNLRGMWGKRSSPSSPDAGDAASEVDLESEKSLLSAADDLQQQLQQQNQNQQQHTQQLQQQQQRQQLPLED